jgi:hypothetical protein
MAGGAAARAWLQCWLLRENFKLVRGDYQLVVPYETTESLFLSHSVTTVTSQQQNENLPQLLQQSTPGPR